MTPLSHVSGKSGGRWCHVIVPCPLLPIHHPCCSFVPPPHLFNFPAAHWHWCSLALVFTGVGVGVGVGVGIQWHWHSVAFVGIGVHHCQPGFHRHQHHHLPLWAVAHRQGGGAVWCGIGWGSSAAMLSLVVPLLLSLLRCCPEMGPIATLWAEACSGGTGPERAQSWEVGNRWVTWHKTVKRDQIS